MNPFESKSVHLDGIQVRHLRTRVDDHRCARVWRRQAERRRAGAVVRGL